MPTYEYACTNPDCGNRFERVQAFTDPSVTSCPVCDQAVRKVYGSVGVVFKGSGFYRNDSRAEASSSVPSTKGSDSAKSESSKSSDSSSGSNGSSSSDSSSSSGGSSSGSSSSGSSSSGGSSSGGSSSGSSSSGGSSAPATSSKSS
jgi:putative FmdB family regulatory protein